MDLALWSTVLRTDEGVIELRQRARRIAAVLGFDVPQQTRVATAVSEVMRSARAAQASVQVEFRVQGVTAPQLLSIIIRASGERRWLDEDAILNARRLVDRCEIDTERSATTVSLRRVFPRGVPALTAQSATRIARELEEEFRGVGVGAFEELQQQNQELAVALRDVETRQHELARVNAELSDTNRGVLSLYAELDERADHLRRADELKTRFLSDMSHEFRTPLNSVVALSGILLNRIDGPLNPEQEKQITLISTCASGLLELVNDLLDIAKVEAGKVEIRPIEFALPKLFGALRGMLRPLLVAPINLVFEDCDDCPVMFTDEGKLSQILRNLLSNALKFTERGEVRVTAKPVGDTVLFSVTDTGFGIATEDHERIFQDFSQIENPYQARVRGTGLGLPLSRKLAEMLGGRIWVESELGKGSTFYVSMPVICPDAQPALAPVEVPEERTGIPVLVLDDSPVERAVAVSALSVTPFRAVEAESLAGARRAVESHAPVAAIVDIALGPEDSWRYIAELKQREIPVLVLTVIEDRRKAFALGADSYATKPVDPRWLEEDLYRIILRQRLHHVAIADDDPNHRYLLRSALATVCPRIVESDNGLDAVARVAQDPPDVLIVDWLMPGLDGFEVIERVRALPNGGRIAILMCTSKEPGERERELFEKFHVCFHRKDDLGNRAVLKAVVSCTFATLPPTPAGMADGARTSAAASASR